ncbi:PP-loop family protein [Cryptosporidium muris RN66]|uniref:PP-loop family protein n=1 Tax=Cryptosporidium muris (strain RN66) TaxID=441375 RepID=B6AA28_CRYMR|nr:PP-loop family protein [Cryptosporidium muris RN66]EEA05069.1 PP-loop family protein [Cryptosporidium muris RN66]|eukprot:XP_002139418.1 PP-loop family protein [Cryptosporidium muris RN66]
MSETGCYICGDRPVMRRCESGQLNCKYCFLSAFEEEVHEYITSYKMFSPGEVVAIGISGGKDSSVLLNVMYELNKRKEYGLDLRLVAIDEGIKGYRDDALKVVNFQKDYYDLPLTILQFQDLFGTTMDDIRLKAGKSNSCTFCGVFRRRSLDVGGNLSGADKLCTGHNADDAAETVLLNILRGDLNRLQRCTNPITSTEIKQSQDNEVVMGLGTLRSIPRVKPLMYCFEKEIVLYAYYSNLRYFSTECKYSVDAYRGFAREFIRQIEGIKCKYVTNFIRAAENFNIAAINRDKSSTNENKNNLPRIYAQQVVQRCTLCGYMSSARVCKGCLLLETLRTNNSKITFKSG